MISELTDFLNTALADGSMGYAGPRVWVWKNECAVVDFIIRKAKFGFNLTPVEKGLCDLDFVPRNKGLVHILSDSKWSAKQNLARSVTPDDAWAQITEFVAKLRLPEGRQTVGPAVKPAVGQAVRPLPATSLPRVGVLTLPLNRNFGGNIQAFAMTDTLARLGVQPVLLDRRMAKGATGNSTGNPGLADSIALPKAPMNTRFLDRNIAQISTPLSSSEDLNNAVEQFGLGAIIVGSDQVWRPKYAKDLLRDFFFDAVPDGPVRRISYAASFGSDRWEYSAGHQAMARNALKKFDAVSCREDIGARMCREHLDIEATHVLDPTLLVPPQRYEQITAPLGVLPSSGQIVTYVLDKNKASDELIDQTSRRLGLSAFTTSGEAYASQNPLAGNAPNNSPERWIAAIAQAGLVVTDSFHGMVFSIIFNRPFVAFANRARGTARFTSLLNSLSLQDRLVMAGDTPDIDALLQPVDWDSVNALLDQARTGSLDFLRRSLGLPENTAISLPDAVPVAAASAGISAKTADLPVLCTGCGACASEIGPDASMEWDENGFLVPVAPGGKIPAAALKVCPFNPSFDALDEDVLGGKFLGTAAKYHPEAGHYEAAFIGHSIEYRDTSSSGGVATWVFEKLLRNRHADAIFVVKGDAEGGYSYQMFSDVDDIKAISKTRYYPVTLADLYGKISGVEGKVAVCGVACFVKSVRLKQTFHPELADKISFIIGIICGGLKSSHYTDYLAGAASIRGPYRDADYRVKNPKSNALDYSFSAMDKDGVQKKVRMAPLGDMWGSGLFKAKACDFCSDVTTELADLSLGDAWLPEYIRDGMGSSVVVARSALALSMINEGIAAQELTLGEVKVDRVIKSQQGGFDHKRRTLKFRVAAAQQRAGYLVPHVRARVLTPVSAAEAIVQVLRERVRAKSHIYWPDTKSTPVFDRRMNSSRNLLHKVTRMRKKNYAEIERAASAFLEYPVKHQNLQGDLVSLRPIMRWMRKEIAASRISLDQVKAVVDIRQ